MGVRKKSRRKIVCGNKEYVWYILAGDRDYWMRVAEGEWAWAWETPFLHVISSDKTLVLTVPLTVPRPYAVSRGRTFHGKKSSGRWERYLLPFPIPRAVTPRFIAELIEWAESPGDDVSQNWGGDLQY